MPLFQGTKQHSATYALARFLLPDSARRVETIRLERMRTRRVRVDGPAPAATGDGDTTIPTVAGPAEAEPPEVSVPGGPPNEGPNAESKPGATADDREANDPKPAEGAEASRK